MGGEEGGGKGAGLRRVRLGAQEGGRGAFLHTTAAERDGTSRERQIGRVLGNMNGQRG